MNDRDSENSFLWVLVAIAAVGFSFWHSDRSSHYQAVTQQLQKDLASCQLEFKSFKDGVTYGANK